MKRFGLTAALIFLAGTAVSCSDTSIKDKYRLLKTGMNRDKVVSIMGNPAEERIIQQRKVPPLRAGEDLLRHPYDSEYLPEILQMVWIDGDKKATVELTDDKLTNRQANFAPKYIEIK
ncbi:MAG: hypothetical protein HZA50_11515 [Planctomycetes bacterium]|nr:hypothetical protein [Planctomycetota bacterium]